MPRKSRTIPEPSGRQVIEMLDDLRLTLNDVQFGVGLMAVHQEAMLRTIERWVHHLEDQEAKRFLDAADEANAQLKQQRLAAGQRQGSPEASKEPERSRSIAGPSTPASSSGSIL